MGLLLEHPHDVAFLHDQVFDAIDLDLGARPLAEQDPITRLDVNRDELAGFVTPSRTDGDDFALLRFLFGGIRNDDASGSLFFGLDALDHNSIMKRTEFHGRLPNVVRVFRTPSVLIGPQSPDKVLCQLFSTR